MPVQVLHAAANIINEHVAEVAVRDGAGTSFGASAARPRIYTKRMTGTTCTTNGVLGMVQIVPCQEKKKNAPAAGVLAENSQDQRHRAERCCRTTLKEYQRPIHSHTP